MPDFDARELSDIERWVSFYEWFVDSVRDGYDMCIHEYTNDLSCRDQLQRRRDTPEVQAVWTRVIAADAAFRAILLPTKRSISRRLSQVALLVLGLSRWQPGIRGRPQINGSDIAPRRGTQHGFYAEALRAHLRW